MAKMRKKWQKMAKNEKKMAKNGKNFKKLLFLKLCFNLYRTVNQDLSSVI